MYIENAHRYIAGISEEQRIAERRHGECAAVPARVLQEAEGVSTVAAGIDQNHQRHRQPAQFVQRVEARQSRLHMIRGRSAGAQAPDRVDSPYSLPPRGKRAVIVPGTV